MAASVMNSVSEYVGTSITKTWLMRRAVRNPVVEDVTARMSSSVWRLPFISNSPLDSRISSTALAAAASLCGASTIEAAALCKMADRGQITGGVLDGPLAFDNAIDPEAVKIKGIKSPVAGRAQILIVPDLEAGNMLAKNLTFLARADAAGIVLGARVPIILTSRADSVRSRMASAAVAVLYADARRQKAAVAAV